jgi:hypothetical protein
MELTTALAVATMIVATMAVLFGSQLALREKRNWGYLCNTMGLLGFWIVGLAPSLVASPEEPQPVVEPDALMVKHVASLPAASTLQPLGSSLEPGKYLASRNGKAYHVPTCSHYAPYIRGPIWYDTEEAAKADGKRPCSECLSAEEP